MGDHAAEEEERGAAGGRCLSEAQTQVLDRCLHALRHAKNDSQTLAALLLVSLSLPRLFFKLFLLNTLNSCTKSRGMYIHGEIKSDRLKEDK